MPYNSEGQTCNSSQEELSYNNEKNERRGTHINWTEDDNVRLLSSWLNNSTIYVDPIKGNEKKSEHYLMVVLT
jgi:hypothetical protein